MLFGPCAPIRRQLPARRRPALRRRRRLCLRDDRGVAAGAKTAPAKTLRDVPVVDRLAVRMVTDNIVIQFVPNEKRDGLTIERKSGNTAPDKPPRTILNGEWGLSMHVQSTRGAEERNVLIDFGYTPEVLLNNLAILKIDPSIFDAMVLSHGHYDHFGGMLGFLKAHGSRAQEEAAVLCRRRGLLLLRRNPGGNFGALDRKAIIDADLTLMMAEEPAIVADHAFTTGRIGQTSFEQPLLPTTRSSAFSTASAATRRRCRRPRTPATISPTISTMSSPPPTWSRTRVWWCSLRAAIAA